MIDCDEYLKSEKYAEYDLRKKRFLLESIKFNRKSELTYLCPYIPENTLRVRGHFGSSYFEYVKVQIEGCNPD